MTLRRLGGVSLPRVNVSMLPPEVQAKALRADDKRTNVGKVIVERENAYIEAQGGLNEVTPQKVTLIRSIVRTEFLLENVDRVIFTQRTLIAKRALLPMVLQRTALVASLTNLVALLGLEKRAKPVQTVAEILASHRAERPPATVTQKEDEA